ncbi:MAG: homoserine O-acetyltransferase MetX [Brevibacterium aurantiacum]|uniref:Homoserine O-acetyltransferase n=1 Tax=Brevibacterium aurantiacum TaxID=273384 RepID=A0A1D7W4A7_BREAU|nr:homoserine O-acetyltransferase [Brevibacterium aurantiacum]AOP53812.1 Homoserine O-acetyltransferase [Brevibacterium aurantiacum]AZL09491.1 homoserine O-acetyltransferase [Brevibacterium aurantiacum]AZT93616.1 homoserine O-acetyltransferase [Brevibacterium aurantiacum]MDN5738886.1 homoserine O-acetyltransferase [Brevibacterium aurantiacum]MDN6379349.1 homoserine O-acetyltransferase [Brevibacterium aurantiacum]
MTTQSTSVERILGFVTESGHTFGTVEVAYETFGTLNTERSNAILVEHALTGDTSVTEWWAGIVGPGQAIDTEKYFVVCANSLGGCSGTTGPQSVYDDGLPYGSRFPQVTIRDMARLEHNLTQILGIDSWHAVIGGSMGGARALEFALLDKRKVKKCAIIAAPAFCEADQIAWAMMQERAIELDPDYYSGDYTAVGAFPAQGLGLARQIAHLTYRNDVDLNNRFSRRRRSPDYYEVTSYLDHQAKKLTARFDPHSYVVLTRALRDHDVRIGRSHDLTTALADACVDNLVVSVSSDRLFPPAQVELLAQNLPGDVTHHVIDSGIGHDGFLTETEAVSTALKDFLDT